MKLNKDRFCGGYFRCRKGKKPDKKKCGENLLRFFTALEVGIYPLKTGK
ncbi:hypothetical protein BV121_796 [Haemophilus influenzae]|nr:hypothetical protein BV121_796 [Haemophilus influenzae]AVJ01258.1 hypothetical protein BV122_800 [Haemophilus influenzae]